MLALAAFILILLYLALFLRPERSWPFAVTVFYLGVVAGATLGAYVSAFALVPRRAVVISTARGEVAYLLIRVEEHA